VRRLLALVLALSGVASCGTTVGTIPFPATGRASTVVTLDAGRDVRFWTDFAARFSGSVHVEYEIELVQDGVPVASTSCTPLEYSSKVCIIRIETGYRHYARCRMNCVVRVPKSGPTEVRAALYLDGQREGVEFDRGDLIIKQ
jgi:hypothetical protein